MSQNLSNFAINSDYVGTLQQSNSHALQTSATAVRMNTEDEVLVEENGKAIFSYKQARYQQQKSESPIKHNNHRRTGSNQLLQQQPLNQEQIRVIDMQDPQINLEGMDSYPNSLFEKGQEVEDDEVLIRRSQCVDELASMQYDLMKDEQQLSLDIDARHRRSPKSQVGLGDYQNFQGGKLSQQNNYHQARDADLISNHSFFSRVLEDIEFYHQNPRPFNEDNINSAAPLVVLEYKISEQNDDNYHQLQEFPSKHSLGTATEFTLKKLDFWLYIIGLLVRIQTIVLAYILFGVETSNTCVVVWESFEPLPITMLPDNLNDLPGGFHNVSRVFDTILTFLFITSCGTSIMYINKVVHVIKWHRSSRQEYIDNALPAVRKYKIWNTIFGLFHLTCCGVFMTHAGRVCSGWAISKLSDEERENLDRQAYLFARGGYFIVASVFGFFNLLGFLICGQNAEN